MAKKLVLPKTLGGTSDALYKIKEELSALNRKIKDLEEQRGELIKHAHKQLNKAHITSVKGRYGQISKTERDIPIIEDWDAFTKYVARTKSFDMLQHRVGEAAIKARWEEGKEIPGIGVFTNVGLSITKVPTKK